MSHIELGPFPEASGYEEAIKLDSADPLHDYRSRYVHTEPGLIYLDGNSLGRMPVAAAGRIEEVTHRQWADRLIRSWNEGWWDLQIELGDQLATLLGAAQGEVIISDSTSVNLYKLALAASKASPDRPKIVTDDLNFPTDIYVLEGVAAQTRGFLEIVSSDGMAGPVDALTAALDDDTALLSLSHTTFKSGYTYDMGEVTEAAHQKGARVLWDCSHSVGAMPIDLSAANVDLAIGCTYKYLNGGPGSPAFLFVRKDLQDQLENPITAWWGHAEPFAFDLHFRPIESIRRFHTGTMPILSLAAIEAGLDDVISAGIHRIREKSVELGEYLIGQWEIHLRPLGFGLASPSDSRSRGSHVSLRHEHAWPITRAMIEVGRVIPDFRVPDNIRLGLSPLYTTFLDVHTALLRIREIVQSQAHVPYSDHTTLVT